MVLFLSVDIIQNSCQLTRTHRESTISSLPEEASISGVALLDPFRGRFLNFLDQLRLRNRSWQSGDDVNVISHPAYAHEFASEAAANGREISLHPWPHVQIEPGLAIFCTKNYVENDVT
jgi:hypothetical protein